MYKLIVLVFAFEIKNHTDGVLNYFNQQVVLHLATIPTPHTLKYSSVIHTYVLNGWFVNLVFSFFIHSVVWIQNSLIFMRKKDTLFNFY